MITGGMGQRGTPLNTWEVLILESVTPKQVIPKQVIPYNLDESDA